MVLIDINRTQAAYKRENPTIRYRSLEVGAENPLMAYGMREETARKGTDR
jgi:hypothetical protein